MAKNEFGFPFNPYSIQVDFMKELYGVLDEKKIGLFESPTGTGKSLSIICGSLSWLKQFQEKEKSGLSIQANKLDEDLKRLEGEAAAGDWVAIHCKKKDYLSEKEKVRQLLDLIVKKEERSEFFRNRRLRGRKLNAQRKSIALQNSKRKLNDDGAVGADGAPSNIEDLDLVTYDSDEEKEVDENDDIEELLAKGDGKDDDEEPTPQIKPKILYCSRTHSQLTQFVNEIKKSKLGSDLRLVTLGSRANLCVNPAVNKTTSVSVLNDRCLELQKKTSKSQKCAYLKAKGMEELRDDILAEVQDIEEVATNGKLTSTCSYYATRLAIPEAELIILPYNVLLHAKTRKSYGIDLADSVVIVDEAHNLIETIASVHSNSLCLEQLVNCSGQLSLYLGRYKKRLNPKNLFYLEQMMVFVNSIVTYLKQEIRGDKKSSSQMCTVLQFKLAVKIENLNLFKLLNHCEKAQLARKLFGFSTSAFYRKQPIADENDEKDSSELPVVSSSQSSNPVHKDESNERIGVMSSTKQAATGIGALLSRMTKQKAVSKKRKLPATDTSAKKNKRATEEAKASESKGKHCNSEEPPKPTSPLYQILEFIKCLTNPASDGRVLITRGAQPSSNFPQASLTSLKYLLLNPSNQFKEVVNECRAMVLAGGTMKPFSEFTDLLLKPAGVAASRIVTFSCGHVIPEQNLLSLALSHGPLAQGPRLDFSYSQRMNEQVIEETGRVLNNLANCVPDGIVVFFSSYEYEQKIYSHWERSGLIKQLEAKGKRVFREPRKASQVNQILAEYARAIRVGKSTSTSAAATNNTSVGTTSSTITGSTTTAIGTKGGAFLFSVVGGKMSEGINFSDSLGRCIVMVGLPYGNIASPELREKMNYLDREQGQGKGRFYYENLCMKAVNQSIGRAIRHKDDYGVIVLLDHRYCSRQDIRAALPQWIGNRLQIHNQFSAAHSAIQQFFADKS